MATLATVGRQSGAGTLERLWWRRGALFQRLAVWILMLVFLLPIVWAVSASLKTRVELYQALPSLLPLRPTLAMQRCRRPRPMQAATVVCALSQTRVPRMLRWTRAWPWMRHR